MQHNTARGEKGLEAGSDVGPLRACETHRARTRADLRIALEMTVSPDEEEAAIQFRVSDLVQVGIALAGGPSTTPDWTVVDGRAGCVETMRSRSRL